MISNNVGGYTKKTFTMALTFVGVSAVFKFVMFISLTLVRSVLHWKHHWVRHTTLFYHSFETHYFSGLTSSS